MLVVVGRIGRAHGVRGDVAVDVRTDEPDRRFVPGATLLTDPADRGPLVVERTKMHSGRLLVHFEEVDDRSNAESLRGVIVLADVDPTESPAEDDEFYDRQLIGLEVIDVHRGLIGTVSEVIHRPGQDLLAVRRGSAAEVLIPFVAQLVTTVEPSQGRMTVDLPPGLVELGEE